MSGWVKIHRQILEWEWYDDINTCRLFFHLLIKANHKERNYKGKVVNVGETLTGLDKLSNETNLSVQQIRTSLNKLKSTNEITINSSPQGTVIKVVNYGKYQVATSEPTDEQQTNNKRVTTNKNEENENNEKKIPTLEEFIVYGLEQMPDVNVDFVRAKYNSWVSNDWCTLKDGKDKPIKNWKSTLNNTLPYLPKKPQVELTQDQIFYNNVMRQINERNS
jgi:predicted transcriptional regulator